MLALADRLGPAIPELEVRRPSLEDVYLAMLAEVDRAAPSPTEEAMQP